MTTSVPQLSNHEEKDWFIASITRSQAEELLARMPYDGSFLVRPSEKEVHTFAISFRAENKIKHCRIKQEERVFTIGTATFESLVCLVNYYKRNPLYRRVKLKYAVNYQTTKKHGRVSKIYIFFFNRRFMVV